MGNQGAPSAAIDEPPKKKGFNLSMLIRPAAEMDTSIGKVYLYPLQESDVDRFKKLATDEPSARLREFLPCLASLTATSNFDDDREPLAPELISRLSEAELENIAAAYVASAALQTARIGSKDKGGLARLDGETATAYLDRLLKRKVEDEGERMQRMRRQMLAATNSIFDPLRKSSSLLSNSLIEYEKLTSASIGPRIDTRSFDPSNLMAEQQAQQVRERAEELEMVRLTGQMTAQSATTLRDLAEAATVLLARLEERDQKSDKDIRRQLRIAVVTVVISAVLAVGALIYSGAAFYQDKTNNAANDRWQANLLSSINEGNRERSAMAEENGQTQFKLEVLNATISRMSTATNSEPPTSDVNSADSASQPATSPGETPPPP